VPNNRQTMNDTRIANERHAVAKHNLVKIFINQQQRQISR